MDLSLYLSRFFGLYLLIACFLLFIKKESLQAAYDDFFNSPGLLLVSSIFTLILGLFLSIAHNVWDFDWRLIITLLCYTTVVKAIVLLFFPNSLRSYSYAFLKPPVYYISLLFTFVLGLYLTYEGYIGQTL